MRSWAGCRRTGCEADCNGRGCAGCAQSDGGVVAMVDGAVTFKGGSIAHTKAVCAPSVSCIGARCVLHRRALHRSNTSLCMLHQHVASMRVASSHRGVLHGASHVARCIGACWLMLHRRVMHRCMSHVGSATRSPAAPFPCGALYSGLRACALLDWANGGLLRLAERRRNALVRRLAAACSP